MPSAATRRPPRSSASGPGFVTFVAFSVCGLLAGVAGVLWGMEFGTINATAATGVTLQVIAAVVVGGVNIFGGSGTVVGAALGALFLGFIQNALILLRLSQFWLQAIYGVVILARSPSTAFLLRAVQRSREPARRGDQSARGRVRRSPAGRRSC